MIDSSTITMVLYSDIILFSDELELSGFIPSHSFGIKPISAKLSFLLFLWYIANTEPLRTMSDRFDISISSVFRVLRRVVTWLLIKFDSMIKWPQSLQAIVAREKFSSKKDIPKVLGAIDGTHIRIEKPLDRARDYCNRKNFSQYLCKQMQICGLPMCIVVTPVPFMMLVFSEDLSYIMKHL